MGPLLFLVYINDLPANINHCNIRLFADDTCLFLEVDNRHETAAKINADLSAIDDWSKQWIVNFSPSKTKSLIISNKKDSTKNPPVFLNNRQIAEVSNFKYLGVHFTSNLKWGLHIETTAAKAQKRLNMIQALKWKLDRKSLEIMYVAFVLSTIEYANVIWGGTYDCDMAKLEKLHIEGRSNGRFGRRV